MLESGNDSHLCCRGESPDHIKNLRLSGGIALTHSYCELRQCSPTILTEEQIMNHLQTVMEYLESICSEATITAEITSKEQSAA